MKRKSKEPTKSAGAAAIHRRNFMGTLAAAAGSTAVAGLSAAADALAAPSASVETVHFKGQSGFGGGSPFRCECDIRDCDIEGEIPLRRGAGREVGAQMEFRAAGRLRGRGIRRLDQS